jgi:DNA polymerase III epsilon subunit family exonuclease
MFALPTTLVAFDLETTGLSPQNDEIIEIGAVKFQFQKVGTRMEVVEKGSFQSLVKPDRHIPEEATRVNHITDAMVAGAPVAREVLPNFLRFCGQSSLLVAHNGHSFDAPFLREACRKAGVPVPRLPVLDSLKISRNVLRESSSHKLSDIAQRLATAGEIKLKVEQGELHRALYDCQVLAQVVGRMLLKALPEKDLAFDRFQKAAEKLAPISSLEN